MRMTIKEASSHDMVRQSVLDLSYQHLLAY